MDEIRLLLLATLIGGTAAGTLYAGVRLEQRQSPLAVAVDVASVQSLVVSEPGVEGDAAGEPPVDAGADTESLTGEGTPEDSVLWGADLPDLAELERLDEVEWNAWLATAEVSPDEDILLEGGMRIGPLSVLDPAREAEAQAAARRRARAAGGAGAEAPPRPRATTPSSSRGR